MSSPMSSPFFDDRAGLTALTARPRRAGVAEAAMRAGVAEAAVPDGVAEAAVRAGPAQAAMRDGVGVFAALAGAPHSGYFMTTAPAARAAEKILDRCCRDGVLNDPRSPITPGGDPRKEILAGRANQLTDEHPHLTPAPHKIGKPRWQPAGLPPFHRGHQPTSTRGTTILELRTPQSNPGKTLRQAGRCATSPECPLAGRMALIT
jgi:hypothetical protein